VFIGEFENPGDVLGGPGKDDQVGEMMDIRGIIGVTDSGLPVLGEIFFADDFPNLFDNRFLNHIFFYPISSFFRMTQIINAQQPGNIAHSNLGSGQIGKLLYSQIATWPDR
jgi:hypothetical protein